MASFSGSAADMLKSMGAAVPDQMPQTSLEESQAAKAKYDAAKAAEACANLRADEDCGVDHAHAHVHTADCSHDHGHGHAAVEPAADKGHGHGHGHSETPAVVAYEGTAKGKYAWDGAGGKSKAADGSAGSAITDYAWGDGKKVSVYVDLVGLDAVSDGALSVEVVSPRKVVFTAQMPGGTRVLSLAKLEGDVTKATFIRKLGKDRVVLKLVKAEQEEWHQLNDGQAGGGDDEEGGGPPGGGGMGGMPGGMGGMGGMMGGGGGGMGGMDMEAMMAAMGGAGGMGGMGGLGGLPGGGMGGMGGDMGDMGGMGDDDGGDEGDDGLEDLPDLEEENVD